jgi:hypothetical protein
MLWSGTSLINITVPERNPLYLQTIHADGQTVALRVLLQDFPEQHKTPLGHLLCRRLQRRPAGHGLLLLNLSLHPWPALILAVFSQGVGPEYSNQRLQHLQRLFPTATPAICDMAVTDARGQESRSRTRLHRWPIVSLILQRIFQSIADVCTVRVLPVYLVLFIV